MNDQTVWIACRQVDDRGVFRMLPVDPSIRSLEELPTEAALQEMAAFVEAIVALPGGESGIVDGYLTGDGDLYVEVPEDVFASLVSPNHVPERA